MALIRRVVASYRDAFSGLPREVWLLSAATLVNRAGTMVLPFLTLYFTQRLQLSASAAGLLMGLWGIGSMIGSYAGGRLSDRFDPSRVQQLSFVATGVGFAVLPALDGPVAVGIGVVAVSAVTDVFRPALFAATARVTRPRFRARAFALIRLATNVGMAVGPAAGGLLAAHRYEWLFAADAATCWAAAVLLAVALPRVPRRARPAEDGGEPADAAGRSPWRDRAFLGFLAGVFALSLVFFQMFLTMPVYLRTAYGMSERAIGALLAGNAALIALLEMVLMRAVEHRDRLLMTALGTLLTGLGLALLPLGPGLGVAVLAMLVATVGEMLALPMANAAVADRAPDASTGAYMGAYTLAFACAFVLSPMAGLAVLDHFGGTALWLGVGVTAAIAAAGFVRLARPFRGGC